ncbi:Bax inhibitor-1/YccA family protein [Paralimibaculum aggregatum]|uniref:Bax inhibitor-1/YccA family protein n=1 Tax=Paralimibaculum aggregatum TaxID=3036245 RepID=A0ABQ6LPW2_9RHOB|nr:Bax inhibitor-1/YccA family protein [Limibaculum sp. NKW23]GMG83887.1 Bax inhibitor-1/YccA family protein [Limibaculum sp. NKW23]
MANPNYVRSHTIDRAQAAEIDAGLRAHMNKVYALMGGAMVITALVSYIVGMDFKAAIAGQPTALIPVGMLETMFTSPVRYIIMFAPLAMVFLFSMRLHKMSAGTANMVFWGFAALMGLSISWIFAVFTGISIAQTFMATAAGFGAMSLYGYTTKKDLSGWGRFLFMGVIGLIVASLLNMFFFESSAMHWAISFLGVLIFAGLTAYDTQNIKNTYLQMRLSPEGEAWLDHAAISGALQLYLNFLNMFMFLLQFMGSQE